VDTLAPLLLRLVARGRALRVPFDRDRPSRWPLWLALQGGTPWNDELSGLSPVSASDQRMDEALRNALGAPDVRHLVVVTGDSEQAALETAERIGDVLAGLQTSAVLAGYDSRRAICRARPHNMPASGRYRMPRNCGAILPKPPRACRFAPEHLRRSLKKRKRRRGGRRWCVRICAAPR